MARLSEKRITKTAVDALKQGATLWDAEVKGFGCRCQAKGRFYILKYRTSNGRQRWHTIGQHGAPWTPDMARRKAMNLKAEVNKGVDPSGNKQQKRLEKSVTELADRYLSEHVRQHNKPSTAAEVERIIEKRIKPALGRLKITELTRADVKRWHQSMSETPYEANRSLAYFSKMLSLAATDWELRPDNPCLCIKRFPEKARERFFSDDEMKRLGKVLAEAEQSQTEPAGFILLIRLLATTGMRLGEALALEWTDIDLQGRAIRLRDAKAGARTVHLGAEAVAILDSCKQPKGAVIVGHDGITPLTVGVIDRIWRRIREQAGIPDGRLHDLRHTFGTYAALSGANAFAVRDLLGHKTLAMTNRYVERAADMVRSTVNSVSSRVGATLLAGDRKGAEIVKLPLHGA